MRRDELIEALHASPFRPFRMYVSDGRNFDVRHPEMLMVARHTATVGVQTRSAKDDPSEAYPEIDRFAFVDLLHVTGIEQLSQAQRTNE